MRWTGIASPENASIDEDVEFLRRLALEREPGITQHELDGRVAVLEEREIPLRDLQHGGVDVVEPEHVALGTVRRDRPGAEPDHPDSQRREPRVQHFQEPADAGRLAVIGRWRASPALLEKLPPVHDRPVHQRAMVVLVAAVVFQDAHDAIEIALGADRRVIEHEDYRCGAHDRSDSRHGAKNPQSNTIAADLPEQQQRAQHKAAGELEIGGQHERRDNPDQHRPDGAAQREHQVEPREVARRRLQTGELAVTEHAREEEACAEDAELQAEPMLELLIGERVRHRAERHGRQHPHEAGPVPARSIEAEDERQKVDARAARSTAAAPTRCPG